MIFRLSQKLNTKIKAGTLPALPLDENPLADWSAGLFLVGRTQHILVSNTQSLYSTMLPGKGVTNDSDFIERALSSIREFMEADGQQGVPFPPCITYLTCNKPGQKFPADTRRISPRRLAGAAHIRSPIRK